MSNSLDRTIRFSMRMFKPGAVVLTPDGQQCTVLAVRVVHETLWVTLHESEQVYDSDSLRVEATTFSFLPSWC